MFSALIKAFTGRAGWLASLLALLIVAVIAYATVTSAPRIQQKLLSDTQTLPQSSTAETKADKEMLEFQETADANTDNQGQASNILPGPVEGNEVANGVDAQVAQTNTGQDDTQAMAAPADIQTAPVSEDTESDLSPIASSEQVLDTSKSEMSGTNRSEQSSLSLRYDGLKLHLNGHLADDQLAQLITEEIRNAIPRDSELTSDVDGQGQASPLNWMGQFLAVIARLPDDAQGVITGSDIDGVQIVPDAEQKLVMAPLDESGNLKPLDGDDVIMEPESDPVGDTEQAVADEQTAEGDNTDPADFILNLNQRVAEQAMFTTGDTEISALLADELDQLSAMMHTHPDLLLRIVGNLDFSVNPREAEYVGADRARQVRDYLRAQGVESYRVFAAPLPRDYAFDKRVQVVFYISE